MIRGFALQTCKKEQATVIFWGHCFTVNFSDYSTEMLLRNDFSVFCNISSRYLCMRIRPVLAYMSNPPSPKSKGLYYAAI